MYDADYKTSSVEAAEREVCRTWLQRSLGGGLTAMSRMIPKTMLEFDPQGRGMAYSMHTEGWAGRGVQGVTFVRGEPDGGEWRILREGDRLR